MLGDYISEVHPPIGQAAEVYLSRVENTMSLFEDIFPEGHSSDQRAVAIYGQLHTLLQSLQRSTSLLGHAARRPKLSISIDLVELLHGCG